MLKDILNTVELNKVEQFVADEAMVEAVKKVVLSGIYYDGTMRDGIKSDSLQNFALALASNAVSRGDSDAQLGSEIRASLAAVQLLEVGFKKLEDFKKPEVQETPTNPAR